MDKAEKVFTAIMKDKDFARQVYQLLDEAFRCPTCEGSEILSCDCPGVSRSGAPVCGDCSGKGYFSCPDCT